ncbi:xanthine dehydrogenase family protein subunit M [Vineibacter terrae]|uniref:Xanthine dehydrogenase family protein subunit M n=1 Tax=Vineibacter terrae TaxID=2586908 RepID=A0A5C8PQR2_9HYPH|nr:xanthine dehydrogenase family protein subunit M [Vineibacter terrae]TXL78157.1 xanthine dehydrogenase family protein subunit M [Vineibacter terrae]
MSFQVHHPQSVADAIALSQQFGDAGRFIAGGTDLVIQINRKRQTPAHLIDLNRLDELAGIAQTPDGFAIGALATHKAVERHPPFQDALRGLVEAARVVGGHQVRNIATVGGNIANASPAADVVVPLLALDARVSLVGPRGARTLALGDFLLGPGRTAREAGELIDCIHIARLPQRSATAFLKAGRRKAMEISVVCVAARLTLDDEGRCAAASLALGAVGATAMRAGEAEKALVGRVPDDAALRDAAQAAAAACNPISDVRASARYRRLLVEALVPRALRICVTRIREGRT